MGHELVGAARKQWAAEAVVGSHGLWVGEAADGQENGPGGCWFSGAMGWGSCRWFGKRAKRLLVVGSLTDY